MAYQVVVTCDDPASIGDADDAIHSGTFTTYEDAVFGYATMLALCPGTVRPTIMPHLYAYGEVYMEDGERFGTIYIQEHP